MTAGRVGHACITGRGDEGARDKDRHLAAIDGDGRLVVAVGVAGHDVLGGRELDVLECPVIG